MCWGRVSTSTKARSAVSLCRITVHSKTSLREALSLPVGGGANNWRDGKVKAAGI